MARLNFVNSVGPPSVSTAIGASVFNVTISDALYSMIVSTSNGTFEESTESTDSRTDLDSHANMPVVGKNAYIFRRTGKTAPVSAFSPDYEPLKTNIVDAAIIYQCPYTGILHLLIIMNALHVPSMTNNLIAPFIMRQAGIEARDTPKIQLPDPGEGDHALTIDKTLRIPLKTLWDIFLLP